MNTAWIDARHPMVNTRLWGLTLLERNVRELHKLGFMHVTVVASEGVDPLKQFCHPPPASMNFTVRFEPRFSFQSLIADLSHGHAVLVLEGHAFNDRRLLKELISAKSPCAVVSPSGSNQAAAAWLSAEQAFLFSEPTKKSLTSILSAAVQRSELNSLDLSGFKNYIENLRREIPPFLLLIETNQQLQEADGLLRKTVHKGVLEFVAKHIHPPLEFRTVRLLAHTPVSPNFITILWLILAAITIPLFATGHLLLGCLLAAASGVLDGIDGKLARLTLRFSKTGDLLDHIGGTLYDGIWYLALGWYFTNGDLHSTAAIFTSILVVSYLVERIVPGIFRKLHKAEIHDYENIDIFVRLIGSRMNNNIWAFMVGVISGLARETFYAICVWMLATALWHTFRLSYVTLRARSRTPILAN